MRWPESRWSSGRLRALENGGRGKFDSVEVSANQVVGPSRKTLGTLVHTPIHEPAHELTSAGPIFCGGQGGRRWGLLRFSDDSAGRKGLGGGGPWGLEGRLGLVRVVLLQLLDEWERNGRGSKHGNGGWLNAPKLMMHNAWEAFGFTRTTDVGRHRRKRRGDVARWPCIPVLLLFTLVLI